MRLTEGAPLSVNSNSYAHLHLKTITKKMRMELGECPCGLSQYSQWLTDPPALKEALCTYCAIFQ